MGKRDEYIEHLLPLLKGEHLIFELEEFLISNSNLPGPRGNLELAFACADCFETIASSSFDLELLQKWASISEQEARVNDPLEFLPFCALLALGSLYEKADDGFKKQIIDLLKSAASDGRWRMREAVAMGFQRIGEKNISVVIDTFSVWIESASLVEQRAIIAALAHPPLLGDPNFVRFCLHISDKILYGVHESDTAVRKGEPFRILKKGLEYAISVFVAHLPDEGFAVLKKWAGVDDRDIQRILKSNLEKNRLTKPYPHQVNEVLALIRA